MPKYVFVIEPEASLKDTIVSQKKRVSESFPEATYLSHPPHCTLLFVSMQEIDGWLGMLKKALTKFSSFGIKVKTPHVFMNDILAGGGHTLVYKIEYQIGLFQFQQSLADLLKPFIKIDPQKNKIKEEPFKSSYETYGFNFVGKHWIPHITIASVRAELSHPIISKFKDVPLNESQLVNKISVWEEQNGHHQPIEKFKLEADV